MGSIRAALSGNTTGRQLLLNLKGAGDFLVSGQIYKPFPHTHTTHTTHTEELPFIWGLEPGTLLGTVCSVPAAPDLSQSPVSRLEVPGWGREGGCQTLHPALHRSPGCTLQAGAAAEVGSEKLGRKPGTSLILFSPLQEGWKCPEKEAARGCQVLFWIGWFFG